MRGYSFCNDLYSDISVVEAIERIATAGYKGVELDARSLIGLDLDLTADCCQNLGVSVVGLHWLLAGTKGLHLTHPDSLVRQETLAYLRELVKKCAILGGQVMVLGGGPNRRVLNGVPRDLAIGYAAEVLSALGDDLIKKGVRLGLEPLRPDKDNLLNTAEAAVELTERIACPNIGITLDARAMETESRPREELVRYYARYLVHVHVNDATGTGPGMGTTDLRPMICALVEKSYPGWISVEAFDTVTAPDTIALSSLAYLNDIWPQ
jgi:sugar phosphate isomerase/epimerase